MAISITRMLLLALGLSSMSLAQTVSSTVPTLPTTFPQGKGKQNLSAAKHIGAGQKFDGGMKVWDRSRMLDW
jgi:hypothetical protein